MNFSDLLNNQEFINFINELFDKGFSISIQDEVAWKSIGATGFITAIFTGIVTFFTTYIANKFATKSTLELFDKQEKIRIKNELRFKFYNEYKNLFDELSELITELISNLDFLSNTLEMDDTGNITIKFLDISSAEDLITLCNSDYFDNCLNLSNNIIKSFDKLKDFMDKNKKITNYNKFKYDKEFRFINIIIYNIKYINYKEPSSLLNSNEKYLDKLIKIYWSISNLSCNTCKTSQYEFNNFNEFKDSFFSKHNEILNDFLSCYF